MNLLVSLNNKKIDDYLNYTNSFIIGFKGFSINYLEFTISDIVLLLKKYPNIELFVSLNKNIFNSDLVELESVIKSLSKLNIKGILFYDLAVLSIVRDNNLDLDLVWNQGHMVTNYNTCNYYYDKGVSYAYLASEITVDEIKEIKGNSKIKLMSFLFGYPIVSFSKRKLLSNYFDYYKLPNNKEYYRINSLNSSDYIIKENEYGTGVFYGNLLNGIKPFYELKDDLDYAVLDENFVDHDLFIKVLAIYKEVMDNMISYMDGVNKIYELTNSLDMVFYYKKTIYKVKDEIKN